MPSWNILRLFNPAIRSLKLLSKRDKLTFLSLTVGRALANLIDMVGVTGVGLFGTMVAARLAGESNQLDFVWLTIDLTRNSQYLVVTAGLVSIFTFKTVLALALLKLNNSFLAKVDARMATEVIEFGFGQTLTRIKEISFGKLNFAMSGSTTAAFSGLLTHLSVFIVEGSLFFLIFGIFLTVNPILAFSISAYFTLVLIVFHVVVSEKISTNATTVALTSQEASNQILDLGTSFREIYVTNQTAAYVSRFSKNRALQAEANSRLRIYEGMPRIFIELALIIGLAGLLGWFTVVGSLESSLYTLAIFLAGGFRMMGALLPLQNSIAWMRAQSAVAKDAQEFIERNRGTDDLTRPTPLETILNPRENIAAPRGDFQKHAEMGGLSVKLQGIKYSHPQSQGSLFLNLNLEITSGSTTAIIGPSGSGKSTLADLALGILEPQRGVSLINEIPAREFVSNRPGRIAYVPQKPSLVSGTFAQNVALGVPREKIDQELVREVLEKVNLLDEIEAQGGTGASVSASKDGLSGGQMQRISLARALYQQPSLLILDEATSALDAETEKIVMREVFGLQGMCTVLIIAHRLSSIQFVDNVVVLESGRVTDFGNFKELKESNALVRRYVDLLSFSAEAE